MPRPVWPFKAKRGRIVPAKDPWPREAHGQGSSLHRLVAQRSGNNPDNWFAASPSPGTVGTMVGDSDGDGMPDDWEFAHGLDPFDPVDALLDLDGDGLNNLEEYLAGTDPRDPMSRLAFGWQLLSDGAFALWFDAVPGRSYSLQAQDDLRTALDWSADRRRELYGWSAERWLGENCRSA